MQENQCSCSPISGNNGTKFSFSSAPLVEGDQRALRIEGLGGDYFNSHAEKLCENGFTVTPTNGKRPILRKFQNPTPTKPEFLRNALRRNLYPGCNVGIVCGRVVGIDIDEDDPVEAERLKALAAECLGPTPFERIGRHPRTLLLYRPVESIPSCKSSSLRMASTRIRVSRMSGQRRNTPRALMRRRAISQIAFGPGSPLMPICHDLKAVIPSSGGPSGMPLRRRAAPVVANLI
jgi:hypothetical protein